jgi:segregation and condensation protein B
MANIVSFEDFQKRSGKSVSEDSLVPTGNSTVFIDQEGDQPPHGEHHKHEKNYMFFKNLYAMKKCIDEIMAMDKDLLDDLIENGHDWASDHITSAKDDVQEVFDWIRYEVENHPEEEEEPEEVEVTGTEIEMDDEDGEDDDEDDEDDEDEDDGEEEEESSESKEMKYSYKEEKK